MPERQFRLGGAERGRSVLEAALTRHPYHLDPLVNLATVRAGAGDRDDTLDALRRLESLRPCDASIRAECEGVARDAGR